MIETGKEPSAVFGIDKESFLATNIWILRNWTYLGATIARSSLRRPNANFPTIVKYKTSRTTIFENGIILFVLVKFDASIKLRTILRMTIIALACTF